MAKHPIRLTVSDDLRRSRLTVFFRLALYVPHYFWTLLWLFVAYLVAFVNWFVTLISGRSPDALHNFLAAFVRYQTHVNSFLYLVANPFPGFVGQPGSYPVDLEIDPPERQNRWITGFRLLLMLPAFAIMAILTYALYIVAIFGWFVALITGRMPSGMRDLGAFALRYSGQTMSYLLLLTDRYPYSGPEAHAVEPAPVAPPSAPPPSAPPPSAPPPQPQPAS